MEHLLIDLAKIALVIVSGAILTVAIIGYSEDVGGSAFGDDPLYPFDGPGHDEEDF